MRIFGREISIFRKKVPENLTPVAGSGGWWPRILESFTGAWQQNVEVNKDTVLTYFAVYACITLIAGDISKMRIKLTQEDEDGIWNEIRRSEKFSPFLTLLQKFNGFQNRIQFIQSWIVSKLIHGNAYALKVRDGRGMVSALYILNPLLVKALVSPDGSVFYELQADLLSGLYTGTSVTVPASEIIHDTMICLHHPLIGVSPIYACGLAAMQGIKIQQNSTKFFQNQSRPSGMLTAPGAISKETADRLKENWQTNFAGENIGKLAVLGDGLKYEPMYVTAVDSQLIEQLNMTAEQVCSCFHVPSYKVGVGPAPLNNNVEALDQQYYSQCLQILIESAELCLDEGLSLPNDYAVEFDLDGLLRMDTAAQFKTLAEGVKGTLLAPNEGRKRLNLKPAVGGNSPMSQQQNFSLEALAKRDAGPDPFKTSTTAPPPSPPPDNNADNLNQASKEIASNWLKTALIRVQERFAEDA